MSADEIRRARSVLFAVFARYGDSIIAFKAIEQFARRHPDKEYCLVTTHQARPYAETLITTPMTVYSVNKRRNPIGMWRLVQRLRRDPPDIGFNPWSHGRESEFFTSYCRRFSFYGSVDNSHKDQNLHRRVRRYLQLPDPPGLAPASLPARARRIVICPFSTDVRKGLDSESLRQLLAAVRERFGSPEIVIAGLRHELAGFVDAQTRLWVLAKTRAASEQFIALLRSADLFIGVDAGPLHLAAALAMPAIGLFGPTAPETILDVDSRVLALRHASLSGIFCDVQDCTDPLCLKAASRRFELDRPTAVDFVRGLSLEPTRCRYRAAGP